MYKKLGMGIITITILCKTLLSRLDTCDLWLNSLLLNVFPLSVSNIFRSDLFGSQITVCLERLHVIAEDCPLLLVMLIDPHLESCSDNALLYNMRLLQTDFILLPERSLLKMPHTDGGKTLSRREFSYRPWPSSGDNRVVHSAGCESVNQFIYNKIFRQVY